MPRRKHNRQVFNPPRNRKWDANSADKNENITLTFDEYESIRLLDYEGLKQIEAASHLNVSRPTLTRIYISARKKIAIALVKNRNIDIDGGDIVVNESWYRCENCKITFNTYDNNTSCPICNTNDNIIQLSKTL